MISLIDVLALYALIGVVFALRASHFGRNPAGVPLRAYFYTAIIWPFTLFLVMRKGSQHDQGHI